LTQLFRRYLVIKQLGFHAMHLTEFWNHLEEKYEDLPPKLRKTASYVRNSPSDIALYGLRRVAREVDVSPGTLVRFVQSLGFLGWEEFQSLHRAWLTNVNSAIYSGRVAASQRLANPQSLIDTIAEAESQNAMSGLRDEQQSRLTQAAAIMSRDTTVAILGLRSCHAVASSLAYSLSLFHHGARLMASTGGMLLDSLHSLRADNVLVAISVEPYSRETVEATKFARKAGLKIITLTDAPLGPLARLANVVLTATNTGPTHLASVTGLMALSQALASLTLCACGADGLAALRRYEASIAKRSSFLPSEN
jgi:DNA-binding MurR/RpiR family transcriptional regulator